MPNNRATVAALALLGAAGQSGSRTGTLLQRLAAARYAPPTAAPLPASYAYMSLIGLTSGAWTQVIAAAPSKLVIASLIARPGAAGNGVLALGVGAAGAEQILGQFMFNYTASGQTPDTGPGNVTIPIAAGERVAIRFTGSGNTAVVVRAVAA